MPLAAWNSMWLLLFMLMPDMPGIPLLPASACEYWMHVAVVENSGVAICPCYSMPSGSLREGFRSEYYCSAYRDVFDNYNKIPFAYQRRLCICIRSHALPYNQNSQ